MSTKEKEELYIEPFRNEPSTKLGVIRLKHLAWPDKQRIKIMIGDREFKPIGFDTYGHPIISEENYAYKLGILLDHFENEAHSVRDEEIIIPAILANKGWKLYRLHALNWYENSKYELEKIEKLMK